MFRIKLMMLSLLAVCAVGAVASASASAEVHLFWLCKNVGPGHLYASLEACEKNTDGTGEWERVLITTPVNADFKSGTSVLKGVSGGIKVFIVCTSDSGKGSLEKEGKSSGEVAFSGCTVKQKSGAQFEKCTVTEPIEFKFKDQLVLAGTEVQDEFKPESGTNFVTLNLAGSPCALAGPKEVTGTQNCELPNAEEGKLVHTVNCKLTSSHLTFANEAAEFESSESVNLLPEEAWGTEHHP